MWKIASYIIAPYSFYCGYWTFALSLSLSALIRSPLFTIKHDTLYSNPKAMFYWGYDLQNDSASLLCLLLRNFLKIIYSFYCQSSLIPYIFRYTHNYTHLLIWVYISLMFLPWFSSLNYLCEHLYRSVNWELYHYFSSLHNYSALTSQYLSEYAIFFSCFVPPPPPPLEKYMV